MRRHFIPVSLGLFCILAGCGDGDSFRFGVGDEAPAVEMTWLGVANWLFQADGFTVLADAYLSRPPIGPLGTTDTGKAFLRTFLNVAGVERVDLMVVGHSHFDHALDVGTAALETGASVIGSQTTCFIARAQGLSEDRCTAVTGGEELDLNDLHVRVVRIIHSIPESIGAFRELTEVPSPPFNLAATYPNGGSLGYVFTLRKGREVLTWYYTDTIGPLDGEDGSGIDFRSRLTTAFTGIESVALWIFLPSSLEILSPYVDIIRPGAMLAHHWDGLFPEIAQGLPFSFPAPQLEGELAERGVTLFTEKQYFDKILLTPSGVEILPNREVKEAFGLSEEQPFPPG